MAAYEFVPYLSVTDANEAVAFYSRIFDTAPYLRLDMPDGRVMHCEFRVDGAELLMEPTDMFYGERFARVRDPFGHEWGVTTRLSEKTPEEIKELTEQMFSE